MAQVSNKIELVAQNREVLGSKVKKLRRDGYVPAVLYGKDQEPLSLQIYLKDFSKALKMAGESTLVYVNVAGQSYPTIIHDVSRDSLTDGVLHADFYKVSLDEKIKTNVPVVFIGESSAVKDLGGIFIRNVNELEVEALPQELPHEIAIDISLLKNFGDQILVKDIDLGTNIKIEADADSIVATVQEPMSEEELKASLETSTAGVEDVEVIKRPVAEVDESVEPQAQVSKEKAAK